jgi:predicted CoA-binding protein
MKKTLVIGASGNPQRYSYKAVKLLSNYQHEVLALGIKDGEIGDIKIKTKKKDFKNIHTITLYINPKRQKEYYDYIINLQAKRIIFNPGTENNELAKLAQDKKIEVVFNCTLVMLNSGDF